MSSPNALYIPIHKRTPSSSGSSSPASTSRSLSPLPSPHIQGIYTPAQLLALSHSPLVAQLEASHTVVDALRAVAPEVVQSRRQRKAAAWWARHSVPAQTQTQAPNVHSHRRTSSRGSQSHSESEEDRSVSWRRA